MAEITTTNIRQRIPETKGELTTAGVSFARRFQPIASDKEATRKDLDLGVPSFEEGEEYVDYLSILPGREVDLDGNVQTYEGFEVKAVVFSISGGNNIVETSVVQGDGSVIEIVNEKTPTVQVRGVITAQSRDELQETHESIANAFQVGKRFRLNSAFLEGYNYEEWVLVNFGISQRRGSSKTLDLNLTFKADSNIVLESEI